jgi:hypothetical protein
MRLIEADKYGRQTIQHYAVNVIISARGIKIEITSTELNKFNCPKDERSRENYSDCLPRAV